MLRITMLLISLAFVTGLFATESGFTPFSGENQTELFSTAVGQTNFELGNLFWIAKFSGEGNVTAKLANVSYMARSTFTFAGRTVSHSQSGSGEGAFLMDAFDQTSFASFVEGNLTNSSNANFPNASVNEEILRENGGKLSAKTFSHGDFQFDVRAKNLTDITFSLPGEQRALLFTGGGGAEGTVTVASSFALFNEQDPISPRVLASDTRSISFSSTGGANVDLTKEWNGNLSVSYHFSKPFTGDLLLKGSTSSLSTINVRGAGAPEPSLFISMAASLAGLLALRMRKKQISRDRF